MRVVLAYDGSKDSQAAVEAVKQLPFHGKPELLLVSAVVEPSFDLPQSVAAVEAERMAFEIAERRISEAESRLQPIAGSIRHHIEAGHPSHVVLQAAADFKADLIVVGARGHSALARLLLGSTADYIANHAKCAVLVVRPRAELAGEREQPSRPLSLCLAYDGHPPSQVAFRQLLQFDWPAGTRLHITTMLERPSMLPEDVVYDEEMIQQSRENQTKLVSQATEKLKELEVTYSVRETVHVGAALRNVALRVEADYLFVGDTGKTALGRILLGSTSRYLLHHVECSVWLARPNDYAD